MGATQRVTAGRTDRLRQQQLKAVCVVRFSGRLEVCVNDYVAKVYALRQLCAERSSLSQGRERFELRSSQPGRVLEERPPLLEIAAG